MLIRVKNGINTPFFKGNVEIKKLEKTKKKLLVAVLIAVEKNTGTSSEIKSLAFFLL